MQRYSVYMQFIMRKKIFRLQANEKSFDAERFHGVDKNGDECLENGGKTGGKVRKVSSSVCRFVMIGVRMLTGLHGDADGWACRVSG